MGAFLILSCLIFFMAFNFGLEQFKSSRGLASSEDHTSTEIEKVIIKDLAHILKGRLTRHSDDPTIEDQFLFGFLKGNYRAFKVGKKVISLKLKDGHRALKFTNLGEKKDLVQKFKSMYLSKDVSLEDPVNNRFVASEQTSYSIIEDNVIAGRLDFKFSKDQELLEIVINLL